MAVYQPKNTKYWWISVYRGNGLPRIRVSSGTTEKSKAEAMEQVMKMAQRGHVKRDSLVAAIDDILGFTEQVNSVPITELPEIYKNVERDVSHGTKRVRLVALRKFIRWMVESHPRVINAHQVNRHHVVDYCDMLLRTCNKRKTFNNYRGDLQTVFEKLMYRAGLQENPWKVVKNVSTHDSLSGRAFEPEEITALMEVARGTDDWECAQMIGLYTGFRKGDIGDMRWESLEDGLYILSPSKTARAGVVVRMPIHDALAAFLRSLPRSSEWICPVLHADAGKFEYEKRYRFILDQAGVEPKGAYLSFHCWRHTFATNLGKAGVSNKVRDALGGWTTDIGDRIYDHSIGLDDMRSAIQKL